MPNTVRQPRGVNSIATFLVAVVGDQGGSGLKAAQHEAIPGWSAAPVGLGDDVNERSRSPDPEALAQEEL